MSAATTEVMLKRHRWGPAGRRGSFGGLVTAAGIVIVLALAGVGLFLLFEGYPAFTAVPRRSPAAQGSGPFVWPLLFGTLIRRGSPCCWGTPVAVGIALFLVFYSPRRLAGGIGFVIDLLAAVPERGVTGSVGVRPEPSSDPRARALRTSRLAVHGRLDSVLRRTSWATGHA